jgi:radical SAM superfamily enzyme
VCLGVCVFRKHKESGKEKVEAVSAITQSISIESQNKKKWGEASTASTFYTLSSTASTFYTIS